MKYAILLLIQAYWTILPESKRRRCIFKKSCSKYVYETTQENGFFSGMSALLFRFHNCRSGFQIFEDSISGKIQIILPCQKIINEDDIADWLIKNIKSNTTSSVWGER